MDFLKPLKDVANLDEYISVTQNVNIETKNVKVPINITTVLTLKGMRSLEIEYLIKCGENGIACIILERLLSLPATKAWGSASGLGKELICLIKYWLEAIRKHLLNHSHLWWKFLKKCLIFIKNIRSKSGDIPDLLVEHLTECLLDIATSELPDVFQKYKILYVLNLSCAESTKELRFVLRNMFNDYFVKLAAQMATSGYLPHQYSVLECLIRWLVPRDKEYLREATAEKWFPPDLYPTNAVTIFKHSSWANFVKDARDFLNALNIGNGLVTSVLLRRLSIGKNVIISGGEKRESWLDLNTSTRCATVMLDSTALGLRDAAPIEHYLLYVADDNTIAATLHSESGIKLSITVDNPLSLIRPTDVKYDQTTVNVSLSSRNDIPKAHQALKRVFGNKYEVLLDLNSLVSLSPPRSIPKGKALNSSDDDMRLSHPVGELKRKRRCGGVKSKAIRRGLNTPSSSASTSSLAYLSEKLKALPRPQFDKERVSICAQPALSCVSERTEVSAAATTLQYQTHVGVWNKRLKSQSDNEGTRSFNETIKSQSDTEATKLKKRKRPVNTHNDVGLLLAQSIESNDESVINATIERLSQKKDFDRRNIVDLLVEEQRRELEKGIDSGINTDVNEKSQDTEDNSETIDGTPVLVNEKFKKSLKTVCTVVSKSTTDDESNTEVVNETPKFVTLRDQKMNNAKTDSNTFDINVQEDFFSQHYTGNKDGGIVISPSLARKINESSSESSDHLDNCLIMDKHFNPGEEIYDFNDIEIIECLNDIVDKVCQEFNKCSEYLGQIVPNEICADNLIVTPKRITKSPATRKTKITKTKAQSKPKRVIKIKLKTPEKKKPKNVLANKVKKAKQIIKSPKKMSTITEQTDEEDCFTGKKVLEVSKIQTPKITQKAASEQDNTPLTRRKRKLYSPKDNEIQLEKSSKPPTTDTDDDELLADLKVKDTTPKTSVSCYKEIETERKKRVRSKPKITKGKVQEPPSPRTLKYNETFDKLKDTVESSEKIVLIDKTNFSDKQVDVYNYTSESEDDDFKKRKTYIRKKISSTTISSVNSKVSSRRGTKKTAVNYSETKSLIDEAILPVKRKPPAKSKRTTKQKAITVEPVNDLVDEKMREATDTINTSLIIDKPKTKELPNVEFIAKKHPEMELISDTEEPNKIKTFPKKSKKNNEKVCIKKEKHKKVYSKPASVKEDSRSIASTSPLPVLVVEPNTSRKNDADDSITAQMAQKFKKIYQDGPDQNESNITQNMLSDIERNNSQQNIGLSVTDEVQAEYDNLQVVQTKKPAKTKVKNKLRKPDPIQEFDDEIIEIPEQSYKSRCILRQAETKVKDEFKKTNQRKDFVEVIDISEDKMTHNSSMSIASDRINAHNDSDAAPPSPDKINEDFRPREIEDLDQTARDYFEKLTKEINKSHDNSKETRTSETNNKSEGKSSIMMVMRRLSIDDIGKYLPSPKSSTSSSKRTPIVVLQRIDDIDTYKSEKSFHSMIEKSPKEKQSPHVISKYLPSARSSESGSIRSKAKSNDISEKPMSPVVKISKITLEEFDKWLPPMPKLTNPICRLSPKTKNTPEPDPKPSSSKNKASLRLIFKSNKTKSNKSSNSSAKSSRILRERSHNTNKGNEQPLENRTALHTRSYLKKLESSNRSTSNKTRKSNIISPVRSFQQFVNSLQSKADSDEESSAKIQTITKKASKLTDLVGNDNLQSTDHSEDETSKIRRFVNPDHSEDEISNISRFVNPDDSKNKSIKKPTFTYPKTPKLINSEPIASKFSAKRASSPIRVSDRNVKKPRHEEVAISKDVPSHKSQNDDAVTINESGPSGSSVRDWFRKTEATTKVVAGNVSESSEDAIKYILEKLNTTLDEINRNTNKKFVNLFVETQSQLAQQREMIHKMNEDAMRDLMEYVKNKFVDLNKKSQETATAFMDTFKEQAFSFIKDDRKQKQALILLLKEDVHSILGHFEQKLDPTV